MGTSKNPSVIYQISSVSMLTALAQSSISANKIVCPKKNLGPKKILGPEIFLVEKNVQQAGTELGQAQLKLELELNFTWFKFCSIKLR